METHIGVKEIWQEDHTNFNILWTDEKEQSFDIFHLRNNCPCALCVDEFTGQRKVEKISKNKIKLKNIRSVGRYALSLEYEGHDSGIYTFEYLRSLVRSN